MLKVEDIAAGYDSRAVLDGVSFDLVPGVVSGLIGPNGSGKSTLIRAITRIIPLTHGRVFVGEASLDGLNLQQVARYMAVV
jgi:ABC-type cobalamin/Fe3+-siderophores transport system ATPase subunit